MVRKLKPKAGQKVEFRFAGSTLTGKIEEVKSIENKYGVKKTRVVISDGKHTYPVGPENILETLK